MTPPRRVERALLIGLDCAVVRKEDAVELRLFGDGVGAMVCASWPASVAAAGA